MAQYRFKAVSEAGKIVTGSREASDEVDLEAQLRHADLELIRANKERSMLGRFGKEKVTRRDLITFTFNLEQQIRAGIPLVEGLRDLKDSVENKNLQSIIASLIEKIMAGSNLSEAMQEFPEAFDSVFISLIRAGELSGKLGDILVSLSENLKWQDEIASQTKKAAMYPLFVGAAVIGVVIALMVFLVPELVKFIVTMNQELPWHTVVLISTSELIIGYGHYMFFILLVTSLIFIVIYKKSERLKYWVDYIKLRLWMIGSINKKIIMSRFTHNFSLLYGSGITVIECLKISEGIVGNEVVKKALVDASKDIKDGGSIASSFEKTELFPRLVLRMLKVGENTGALDTSLHSIGYFYNRDVKEALDKLQSMMGPVMTVVLGSILAWVILSVFGPIYNSLTNVTI